MILDVIGIFKPFPVINVYKGTIPQQNWPGHRKLRRPPFKADAKGLRLAKGIKRILKPGQGIGTQHRPVPNHAQFQQGEGRQFRII